MCQYANMQMCQLSGYLFHIVANRNQQFPVGFAVVAVLFADVAAVGDFLGISLGINADGSSRRIDCTDQPGKIKETLLIRFVYTKLQMRDSKFEELKPIIDPDANNNGGSGSEDRPEIE